jgi:hypothetical protein
MLWLCASGGRFGHTKSAVAGISKVLTLCSPVRSRTAQPRTLDLVGPQ